MNSSKNANMKLADMCRANGLKVTPQRMAIFSALADSKEHPSADVVFKQVRKQFPGLSFDTVNRTLMTFAETGLIDVVEGHGGPRRFDPNTHTHHHFHCRQCGNIIDFDSEEYQDIVVPNEIEKKFKVLKKRVVLNGICDVCLKRR